MKIYPIASKLSTIELFVSYKVRELRFIKQVLCYRGAPIHGSTTMRREPIQHKRKALRKLAVGILTIVIVDVLSFVVVKWKLLLPRYTVTFTGTRIIGVQNWS